MNHKDKNFITTVIALFIILAMAMVPFAGCKADTAPKELTVYVWEGYLPDKVVEIFKEETGITLNVNLISDNAAIFTLLKGGGEADIIMPTQNQVNRFYTEGLAQPIDLEKLSNYANITGTFKNQKWSMWDGSQMGTGQTYVVPYVFGTSGIIINTEKYMGSTEDIGWEILFDPQLHGRTSSKNAAESLMICLDLSGIPREDLLGDTKATLEKIRGKATELKENVLKFYGTGAELLDMLKNEEVWVSHIWDGGGRELATGDPKFVYVLPETGGFGWTDTFMIPASANNPDGAHLFIDFMLRPEIAALVVTEGKYTTTVDGSLDLAEGIDRDLYVYKDEEIAKLIWQPNFPEDIVNIYNNFWEELSTIK